EGAWSNPTGMAREAAAPTPNGTARLVCTKRCARMKFGRNGGDMGSRRYATHGMCVPLLCTFVSSREATIRFAHDCRVRIDGSKHAKTSVGSQASREKTR